MMTGTNASGRWGERTPPRVVKPAGGAAVIRVGGSTEVEVKQRKDPVGNARRVAIAPGVSGCPPTPDRIVEATNQAEWTAQQFGRLA